MKFRIYAYFATPFRRYSFCFFKNSPLNFPPPLVKFPPEHFPPKFNNFLIFMKLRIYIHFWMDYIYIHKIYLYNMYNIYIYLYILYIIIHIFIFNIYIYLYIYICIFVKSCEVSCLRILLENLYIYILVKSCMNMEVACKCIL